MSVRSKRSAAGRPVRRFACFDEITINTLEPNVFDMPKEIAEQIEARRAQAKERERQRQSPLPAIIDER